MAGDDFVLPLDALIRSVGVKRNVAHTLFLGAGASISSRIPSAESCIWEWKRSLFLTTNPGLEDQFAELSLPSVRQRIQNWLDKQAIYPAAGSPNEYGAYIKACFPISGDRNAFFQSKIQAAQPYLGYRLLPHLVKSGLLKSVWTTNFDGLTARAASAAGITAIEVGLDSQGRIDRMASDKELLCVSLHGDYRYDELKNTQEELQRQETLLSKRLVEELKNRSIIVCGYSGRDASIMDTLRLAYSQEGSGVLYWCGHGGGDAPETVKSLIGIARKSGRNAFYVPAHGFDDLMTRLALHCIEGDEKEAVKKEINENTPTNPLSRAPFTVSDCTGSTVIKSNAFEMECPGEVFSFDLSSWPASKAWSWLREKTAGHEIVAVPFKGKVLALGSIEAIKVCFSREIKGVVERCPVTPSDLAFEDGAITNLMRETLVKAISKKLKIASDGKSELWKSEPKKKVREGNIMCHAHDSISVHLRRFGSTQYCVLKPSIRVLDQSGADVPREVAEPVKMAILGYQHNKPFNDIMNSWRSQLFSTDQFSEFTFPNGAESAFKFRIRKAPVLARIGRRNVSGASTLPSGAQPLVKYKGIEISEPTLLFSDKQARSLNQDTHPVRGLAGNRPYDYPLTLKGLAPSLRIGVICPSKENAVVRNYLLMSNQVLKPADSERDYLVDFPGFQQAFGLPLEIPEPQTAGWVNCAEPTATGQETGPLSVAQQITTAIESLHSSFAPNVVLIFFPRRWQHLQGYKGEHEHFDVHDFVKAYAVQRGVATQFLSEDTISDQQQCRVWWWLSLALYVKGMRTPWVLSGLDAETAYVGLGFSIDQNAERGNHFVLGCSHIYSARGEGLQYRLSRVENPIMRGKNPFMSHDDARRTGETIRQLFFDAHWKLPRRVVLHKRTPFIKDEREGLLEGLNGVEVLDMLEVVHEPAVRYVSSVVKSDGQIDGDNYPVRRGTVLKLDDYTAQLWVHGATAALNPRLKYFQGKRRVPAPLTVRRHAGSSSLETLASEILGLSKMNWNTFDLYTKLPATLQSSSEIAKIGSLLQRFGASSYDYRLFI